MVDVQTKVSPEEILRRFSEFGFATIPHLGQTFDQHLLGVFRLLESWGEDPDVQVAGLLHSIYGTIAFKKQTVPYDKRKWVESVIGARAENLVYLFCRHVRISLFKEMVKGGEIRLSLISPAETITIDRETARDLAVLNFANIIELRPRSPANERDIFKNFVKPLESELNPELFKLISMGYA